MMSKRNFLGTGSLVLLLVGGLSGCLSNPEKKDTASTAVTPPPAPAPVVQAPPEAVAPPASKPEGTAKGKKSAKGAKKDAKTATVAQPPAAPAAQPAAAQVQAPEPSPGKIGPGMNARGEVVDSSKVESGYGQKVKGLRDWDGEITGRPAPGSKFTRLQIGMPMKQVTDLIGQPSDQGAYITGKAFIPFYFGGDTHRQELVYKGQGRLIFAGGSMGDLGGANLIWIIHNANEPAYR